jgi:hypothetical protein
MNTFTSTYLGGPLYWILKILQAMISPVDII